MAHPQLNPEQRAAVEHGAGPLLIVSGPGTGKTRVITERIVHLLRSVSGVAAENILAVTYTDRAAAEMKARVAEALDGSAPAAELPHISTFHAFCYQALRKRHFDRRLLDKVDVWIFLRRRMAQLALERYRKLAEPGAFLHDLNEFFSRCQDELIEPDDFDAYVAGLERNLARAARGLDPAERTLREEEVLKWKELARVFRASRRLLEESGCSSLGSLIPETVRLFAGDPDLLRSYRERFRYVLVDEFQDTNFAQMELLKQLVAPPYNITAVGDDDQAIYRFRGAAHGAFEMFGSAFPGHKTIYLNRNYRSTKKILRVADVVIRHNSGRDRNKPELVTEKDEGAPVCLVESPDELSEAAWVAEEIRRLNARGTPLPSIAVLYRIHGYRDRLVQELRRRGVPFAVRGVSLLSTSILRDLIAYLRLIRSPHDGISLTRALLEPRWRFPEDLALEGRRQAQRERRSLYDVLRSWEAAPRERDLRETAWAELEKLLEELRKASYEMAVSDLVDELLAGLGLRLIPFERDKACVDALREFLKNWEAKSETRRLGEFLEYFDYFLEAGGKVEIPESAQARDAVSLMTVHAAKGLEFPVVFILSVASRRFPQIERKPVIEFPDELRKGPPPPANIHLQEERRLFFVALTRAKDRLYVSTIAKAGRKPSQFVQDLTANAAVTAADMERLAAPPAGEAQAEGAAYTKKAEGASGLFAATRDPARPVHPPLAEWAGRPAPPAPDGKLRLSATAVEDYLSCPLKFKFSHYLRLPTGAQAALTFGNVMHGCVRRYFELRRDHLPRFEEIEEYYGKQWKSAGFEDSYQEEAYRNAGREQLREFVRRQNAAAMDAEKILLEREFRFELGDFQLEGRIDQVNPMTDGEAELVDYKTGRPRSQKDADQALQLSVYAMAARRVLGVAPARLSLYYLSNNERVSTVRTEKELAAAEAQIREVAEKVRLQEFPAAPGFACRNCDFVPVCPAHEEEF